MMRKIIDVFLIAASPMLIFLLGLGIGTEPYHGASLGGIVLVLIYSNFCFGRFLEKRK